AAIAARRNRHEQGRYLEVYRYARVMTLLASARAGVQPLATVYVDIRDHEEFRRERREAA
ncbi:MAG: CoA ester lyase, partial [Deltaproteobacteria bacterium]|nr:CoA ester lyase [Deltaproteobacteria bacterium]